MAAITHGQGQQMMPPENRIGLMTRMRFLMTSSQIDWVWFLRFFAFVPLILRATVRAPYFLEVWVIWLVTSTRFLITNWQISIRT